MKTLRKIPDWLWLLLLIAALRLVNLGNDNLWFDETFTAWVAKPSTDFWRAVIGDDHPPLWSIIEKITYSIFGGSEFALRLPAALLSIASVILIWRIAVKLGFNRQTALIAGVLCAVLPTSIYYGQEARMYALLTAAVLLALDGALGVGTLEGTFPQSWLGLFIGGICAVYAQNTGVLYILAIGLALLTGRLALLVRLHIFSISNLIKVWRWPVLALAGIVLVWLPWAVIVYRQAGTVAGQFWLPGGLDVGQALEPLVIATIGTHLVEPFQIHLYAAALGITFVGLINSRRWLMRQQGGLILATVIGGPALLAIVSMVWANVYVYRALMPSAAALMLVWAYPLGNLSLPNRRVAWAIMVPVLAISVGAYYTIHSRQDLVTFMQPVESGWQAGDVVYHTSATTNISMGWYSPNLVHIIRPGHGNIVTITDECRAAFGLTAIDIDQLKAHGYKRAWVIYEDSPVNRVDEEAAIQHIRDTLHPQLIEVDKQNDFLSSYLYLVQL